MPEFAGIYREVSYEASLRSHEGKTRWVATLHQGGQHYQAIGLLRRDWSPFASSSTRLRDAVENYIEAMLLRQALGGVS